MRFLSGKVLHADDGRFMVQGVSYGRLALDGEEVFPTRDGVDRDFRATAKPARADVSPVALMVLT
jgi:hypothetical protein